MLTLTNGMLLYHGSFTQVSEIDLNKCKQGKDFGRGFYVTSSYEQAQGFVPLSVNKQVNEERLPTGTTIGYISVFKLHMNPGIAIHLFNAADRNWLHFVASNRRRTLFPDVRERYAKFDIIGGKIADDQTARTLQLYTTPTKPNSLSTPGWRRRSPRIAVRGRNVARPPSRCLR